MLEKLGEPLPATVVAGDWWNEGRAVYGALRLKNGARVDTTWIQLLDTFEYRETIQFMFAEEVHVLEFPSPWLKQHPTIYRRSRKENRVADVRLVKAYDESFSRELRHFHDCVVEGTPCRTPPEGARLDIEVLTQMFMASR
jgi:predicted dehydrogenase